MNKRLELRIRLRKLETSKFRLNTKKAKITSDIDKQCKELEHEHFKLSQELHKLDKEYFKSCKHKEKRYHYNMRDDASFDKYINCKRCKEWIGVVDFDGKERYY